MRGGPLLASALLALTCCGSEKLAVARPPGARLVSPPPTVSSAAQLGRATTTHEVVSSTSAEVEAAGPLGRFFGELRALEGGKRQRHVRVVWLGDSHTAADYLPGAVRASLSERFLDGGPGFVRVGTRPYRHDGLRVVREGEWDVDPDPPARRSLQGDGVFGFAGTRAAPAAGASFSVERSHTPSAPVVADDRQSSTFEIVYRLAEGASFELELGAQRVAVTRATQSELSSTGLAHFTLTAPTASKLVLRPRSGVPRLFGLFIENATGAGVVLDTAGIDGARLETPLAWDEQAFVSELARRAPELFVLSYGTNEAFDALSVAKYAGQLSALVKRVRLAAPEASCLVLGPTDAPLAGGSRPRIGEVTEVLRKSSAQLGCAFVSLQQLMGGEGSFARGLRAPQRLAQQDGLHLTPRGYQGLGRALGRLLLDAYSAGRSRLP